jgi:hypothetical protein
MSSPNLASFFPSRTLPPPPESEDEVQGGRQSEKEADQPGEEDQPEVEKARDGDRAPAPTRTLGNTNQSYLTPPQCHTDVQKITFLRRMGYSDFKSYAAVIDLLAQMRVSFHFTMVLCIPG